MALSAATTMLIVADASAQTGTFPNRAVTLVVPFPPGGGTDLGARILAPKLSQIWGVPVNVVNRDGAAGLVGAEFVSRAAPDGYTLLVGNLGTQSINPSLYPGMPYDPDRAFVPISLVLQLPMVLVVNPSVPARTIVEFMKLARAHPGNLTYGSSGSGGAPHILTEMFKERTGLDILHRPYRGGAPAIADLIAGRVQMAFISVMEANERIKNGQLRPLAVTSVERIRAFSTVPTLAETVAPGFSFHSWVGVLAPQGTSNEIVEKIATDIRTVLHDGEAYRRISGIGAVPVASTPDQFVKLIGDERKRYAGVIREHRIHVD